MSIVRAGAFSAILAGAFYLTRAIFLVQRQRGASGYVDSPLDVGKRAKVVARAQLGEVACGRGLVVWVNLDGLAGGKGELGRENVDAACCLLDWEKMDGQTVSRSLTRTMLGKHIRACRRSGQSGRPN